MKLLEQLPEKLLEWISNRNSFVKIISSISLILGLLAFVPGIIAILDEGEILWMWLHTPKGSPVIVSGGSLYGWANKTTHQNVTQSLTWLPAFNCTAETPIPATFCVNLPNGDSNFLSSIGFDHQLTTINNTLRWRILIPDVTTKGNISDKNALLLCSNPTCDVSVGQLPDLSHVYITLLNVGTSQWENNGPTPDGKYLYFHDTQTGCENTSALGGLCDTLIIARVKIAGQSEVQYTCSHGPTTCAIGVGQPNVELSAFVKLYRSLLARDNSK